MPSFGSGTGTPLTPVTRTCAIDLTSAEDLYLAYVKYFFQPEIDEAGFRMQYGVYDPARGETSGWVFDLTSRIAMMRSLKTAHHRLANALNYFPLPTQITGEIQSYVPGGRTALRYGWMTTMGDLACSEVQVGAPLIDEGEVLYTEVTLPADGSILPENLYVYEPGMRTVRIPIAWREMVGETDVRLYFHQATLVKSSVWRACGASKTPCDCAVEQGEDLLELVDVYGTSNDADGGVHVHHVACSTTTDSTSCATIDNARAGWITPASCNCLCSATSVASRAAYSYVSGRWTIDTLPVDILEAIVAIAAITLPEFTLCFEKTMPQHIRNYRALVPDLRNVPRNYGLQVAALAVTNYKQAKGI